MNAALFVMQQKSSKARGARAKRGAGGRSAAAAASAGGGGGGGGRGNVQRWSQEEHDKLAQVRGGGVSRGGMWGRRWMPARKAAGDCSMPSVPLKAGLLCQLVPVPMTAPCTYGAQMRGSDGLCLRDSLSSCCVLVPLCCVLLCCVVAPIRLFRCMATAGAGVRLPSTCLDAQASSAGRDTSTT